MSKNNEMSYDAAQQLTEIMAIYLCHAPVKFEKMTYNPDTGEWELTIGDRCYGLTIKDKTPAGGAARESSNYDKKIHPHYRGSGEEMSR